MCEACGGQIVLDDTQYEMLLLEGVDLSYYCLQNVLECDKITCGIGGQDGRKCTD